MAVSEKVCFAQIDGHLDTNPKIRKAGSVFATAIFEFLLRRVAIAHSNGHVPIGCVDPEYLSDVLMMTCDEARNGTSRAVTANLISIDEQEKRVYIVGWSAEWGRRPKDGAERQHSFREREKLKHAETRSPEQVPRNETPSRVTVSNESDGSEEKRREEKRERNSAPPSVGGLGPDSPKQRKPRSSKPPRTSDEHATAMAILDRLGRRSGVRYSGSSEHVNLIVRHLRDGVTSDDLRKVIGYCAVELWGDKPEMSKYLRPETLFGPKTIQRYLDAARSWFEKNPGVELEPLFTVVPQ